MGSKKLHVYEVHRLNGTVDRYEIMGQASLEQLQSWVGGMIERAYVETPRRRWVYVNEEGLLEGLPQNPHFPQFVGSVVDCVLGGRI